MILLLTQVKAKCYAALYHSSNKLVPLSVRENVIGGSVCVTVQLLLALSPSSLATTSLCGKSNRSQSQTQQSSSRQGKINYDRWLFGLVLFRVLGAVGAAVGVGSDKQAI